MANSTAISIFHVVNAAINGVSILVCLLAAIMVFHLKLYKMLVNRLALYQVLSALVLASVPLMEVMYYNYDDSTHNRICNGVCIFIGFLVVYTQWMKLLFTMWVTFHIFCFGVLHKNLKKLEALYVVTSLLVPALIAAVPLVTHSYGLTPEGIAYIYTNTTVSFIERFALWDGPAMLMLIAASTAMVVMVIKLARHVYRRSMYEPLTDGDQFWKALKQLLPLAIFPMLFFIFVIPVVSYHVYVTQHSATNEGLLISASVFFALWSMASGATVIIHIFLARICGKPKRLEFKALDTSHPQ